MHEAAALLLASAAAFFDLRTGRIPNAVTLPAIALGLLLPDGSALGALTCAALPLWLFLRRHLGGGDVKLLVALGALLGARAGLAVEALAIGLAAVADRQRLGPWVLCAVGVVTLLNRL